MNTKYSGINGILLNPAVTVSSPYYLDINILSGDLFVENNYLYFAKEDYRFKRFFQKNLQFPTHPPDNKTFYDHYTTPDKNGYENIRIMGPSASITFGRHAIGIYTGVRSVTSVTNLPYEIAKFSFEGLNYSPQYNVNYIDDQKVRGASLAWAEIGINYSYVIKNLNLDYWTTGITVKELLGYAGGYMYTSHINYSVPNFDTLQVNSLTGEGGIALPVDYQSNTLSNTPFFKGKGVGFDLGVTYEKKKKAGSVDERFNSLCEQSYTPYEYRIGFSLLDIGRIKFKENARQLVFNDVSTFWPGVQSYNYTSINNFISKLSNQFYGDSTKLVAGNEIIVGLPAAASLQADYNYRGNWYINGTLIYPLRIMKASVDRPALLAVSPRYETVNFDMSLVASLYSWDKLHLGINARYRGFFLGTEKVSSFFHFTDFTGIDIYFGLKIRFLKGDCPSKKSDSSCGINEYMKFKKKGRATKPRKLK